MGILDFIIRKSVKINDSFFGEMLFFEFKKNPEKNYFECRKYFKPDDKIIETKIPITISDHFPFKYSLYGTFDVIING